MPLPGDTVETGGAGESGKVAGGVAGMPLARPTGERAGPGRGADRGAIPSSRMILTKNLGLDPGGIDLGPAEGRAGRAAGSDGRARADLDFRPAVRSPESNCRST